MTSAIKTRLARLASDYGMLLVLLLLCIYYAVVTVEAAVPEGADAADAMVDLIEPGDRVLIIGREHPLDRAFGDRLRKLHDGVIGDVYGDPRDARRKLVSLAAEGARLDVIAVSGPAASWAVFDDLAVDFPMLAHVRLVTPPLVSRSVFLQRKNILNVANQIAVIAIIAIGMTMVIITGGIDLSVGSLIALSAVAGTLFIRSFAGAADAAPTAMIACCAAAIAITTIVGLFSGAMVTAFAVPPFIGTLAVMLIASGLAYEFSDGESIYQVPDTFVWLGRGADFAGIPNAVVLMVLMYAAAHVLMSRTTLGRHIYAVGGNTEAARLSGVPVRRVLLFVYAASGALAGLGGIILASQLKSGSPTYGGMYELYVIAAVVVGGTSLSGGEGKILGTLIGAFIIAVIRNGMNLTQVQSYRQNVVLGSVILGAVLLDKLKRRGLSFLGSK